MNVLDRVARALREHPDRLALSAANGSLRYRELERAAAGIAECIDPSAERVGILTGDDVETYASILGALMSGKAYVPLNRKNPVDRNRLIAESAALDAVLASAPGEDVEALKRALPGMPEIVYTEGLSSEERLTRPAAADNDLAYLFFTSGTTGVPKGVPIRHGNLAAFMSALLDDPSYGFLPNDRFLQMFELTFDLSVMSFLTPLCIGASCHVVPDGGITSLNVARMLGRDEITVALMVPSVLSYLRRYFSELEFPTLRHSLFCGEALLHELTAEWAACVPNATIRNVYGPTEATIFCTEFVWSLEASAAQSVNGVVPIGVPIGATEVAVVDESGRSARAGVQGELCLLGPQLTVGYWHDEDLTADAFLQLEAGGTVRRAYRTGDLSFANAQGNYVYCGRADAQIQVDGHRVELGEVEHHARAFVNGGNVAAVPVRADDGRQEFVVFVESDVPDEDGMRDYLRQRLPDYMLPKSVIGVSEFPLNLSGKVDRKKLLKSHASDQ